LRLTDYKTSGAWRLKSYANDEGAFGSHLQTPLYTLMAMCAYGCPATAVLQPLRGDDLKPVASLMAALAQSENPWEERLLAQLYRLNQRLEQGDFPPIPGPHCEHCELGALCGRPVDTVAEMGEEE
jgi:hypothetical protein